MKHRKSVKCGKFQINKAEADQSLVEPTSSIMGPRASLSMTPCPVEETSAFCTSSASATGALSAEDDNKETWELKKTPISDINRNLHNVF